MEITQMERLRTQPIKKEQAFSPYQDLLEKIGYKYNLPPELLKAILDTETEKYKEEESLRREELTSDAGAVGLMQIMPHTVKGPQRLTEPEVNITLAAERVSDYLKKYKNNLNYALAAYNMGPRNLRKNRYKPYPETALFLNKVKDNYGLENTLFNWK